MHNRARVEKIVIDTPHRDVEPWVGVCVQRYTVDETGLITEIAVRSEYIHKKASVIVPQVKTFFDVGLNKEVTLSGYGLQMAVKIFAYDWIVENFGGELVDGEVVL